ncbi:major histocompatibility complex class I-related gene protein-like isoform X2 [Nerophis ophidion]|uniref:major histocompatibility complex class I-related gene protein-like isoform X2 n=1 Tax=Nerophis ophidion TaxID=159077 RepID=UPI002AE09CD3|nr:major histocompatibility complex class I-related gene protein-like isoform X2 [Nerophis ophidion]
MFLTSFCLLLAAARRANSDGHSLTYIYTAVSEGAVLAGAQEFTAMGVLDGHVIDYYDSVAMVKVPKQAWMKDKLGANYWRRGSEARRSKQRWFKVNMDILLQRLRHNTSGLHVLQWLHGCHGDLRPDGSVEFRRGVDRFSYDGRNFLSFDYERAVWVAASDAALETKRKWDEVHLLKDYTRAYLNNECVTWMTHFLKYQRDGVEQAQPPALFLFARKSHLADNLLLTCLATGFYHKDAILEIQRDRRALTREDGVTSSGVRPNEDSSFQRRDSVEVLRSDAAAFTCTLRHPASGLSVDALWDGAPTHKGLNAIATAAVISAAVCLLVTLLVWWRLCRRTKGEESPAADKFLHGQVKDPTLTYSLDSGVDSVIDASPQEVQARRLCPGAAAEDTPTAAHLQEPPALPAEALESAQLLTPDSHL